MIGAGPLLLAGRGQLFVPLGFGLRQLITFLVERITVMPSDPAPFNGVPLVQVA